MRGYVHETKRRWRDFQSVNPDLARTIEELVMQICECMTGAQRKKQVDAMLSSESFVKLRSIALSHDLDLGLRDHTDQEFALWIRTLCFFRSMERDHAA